MDGQSGGQDFLRASTLPGPGFPAAEERQLLDAVRRLPAQGWTALVLHLSRLPPPAPRPHHRRVAAVLLREAAGRDDGQAFALRNGDLVLLCRHKPQEPDQTATPALTGTLAQLLQVDAPDPGQVISLWPLDTARSRLLAYVAERLVEPFATGFHRLPAPAPGHPGQLDALVQDGRIVDLLHRQTAVLLGPSQAGGYALRPLFRSVRFSTAALQGRAGVGAAPVDADLFLFRHLQARLDRLLLADFPVTTGFSAPRLHLGLSPSSIMSEEFDRFATAFAGPRPAVEVALMEAAADPEGFARVAARLAQAGMGLVLDGVSHTALMLACPEVLGADLLRLDWSPLLSRLKQPDEAALSGALVRIGLDRVVLAGADGEEAMRWGMALGIRRFQGLHVEAMLGASRILSCPAIRAGPGCTLRQCTERAAAMAPSGRAGCANPALLEQAAPPEMAA